MGIGWLLAIGFALSTAFLLLMVFTEPSVQAIELGMTEAEVHSRIGENYLECKYGSGRIIVASELGLELDFSLPETLASIRDLESGYYNWEVLLCQHGHVVAIALVGQQEYVRTSLGRYPGHTLGSVPETKLLKLSAQ